MANINKVGPGDLITAQFMNSVIDAIQALQLQIDALKGASTGPGLKPVILATLPAGAVTAGDAIQVIGQNFSPGNDIITFAGFTIDSLDGSSSATRLLFYVPDLTFNAASKDVLITVRNNYGTATWPITLLPAKVVPHGQIAFSMDPSVPVPGALTKGNTFTFGFLASSKTSIPEAYTFSLVFSNVSGTTSLATWQSNIKLSGAGNAALPSGALQPFTDLKITLSVTVPAAAADNDSVTVSVRGKSTNNDAEVSRSSEPVVLKVGSTAVVSDPDLVFSNETHKAASALNPAFYTDDVTGKYVSFPYKKVNTNPAQGAIDVTANFKVAGKATYKLDPLPSADWELVTWGPQGGTALTQTGPDRGAGENDAFSVRLKLKRETPADPTAHPESATLKITATRMVNNQPKDSFTVINVRGYVT